MDTILAELMSTVENAVSSDYAFDDLLASLQLSSKGPAIPKSRGCHKHSHQRSASQQGWYLRCPLFTTTATDSKHLCQQGHVATYGPKLAVVYHTSSGVAF